MTDMQFVLLDWSRSNSDIEACQVLHSYQIVYIYCNWSVF